MKKEDIAKYKIIIAIVIVTLLLSGGIFYFYQQASSEYEESQQKLEALNSDIKSLNENPLHLDAKNQELARKNMETARKYIENLYTGLQSRYPKAVTDEDRAKDPFQYKIRLGSECKAMEELLKGANVNIDVGVEKVTFDKQLGVAAEIKPEELLYIQQHEKVIAELVSKIEQAKLSSLNSLARNQEQLEPTEVVGLSADFDSSYRYHTYNLVVSGTYESVKYFINSLNDSKFLFLIRSLHIAADDAMQNVGGGGGAPDDGGETPLKSIQQNNKEMRIAVNDLANVKLSLALDYIDFHSYELPSE